MDRLFFKYLAPLLALSILPLLLSGFFLYLVTRQNIGALEQELTFEISSNLIKEISFKNESSAAKEGLIVEKEIERLRNTMIAMSVSPEFTALDIRDVNTYVDNILAIEPSVLQVAVLSKYGDILYDKTSPLAMVQEMIEDVIENPAFKILEKKQPYFSKVIISENTQEPYLTLGQPILDQGGNFKGALLFKIDLKFIYALSADRQVGEDGYLFLLSEDGYLISHPDQKEFLQNPDYSKYEHIRTILQQQEGTIQNDGDLLSFYTNKYDWTSVIVVPEETALQPVQANKATILSFVETVFRSISYTTVVIILLVLILAVISSIYIARIIINPIVELTEGTAKVAEGNLEERVKRKSNDELGELTTSFNLMTGQLKKNRNELISRNEYIEQQAEELLDRYNRDLEQFAYVTTHDLIEPLRMITSYTQLLKRNYGKNFDGDAEEFMGYVTEGVDRMHLIINDLFEYSHIRTEVKDFEEVNMEDTLERVKEKLTKEIEEGGAEIKAEGLPITKAVPSNLEQLLQNLIANAIKFRDAERPIVITIGVEDRGTEYLFRVNDTGIGFEQKYADKVFEIFKRLNKRGEYTGSGMGLAITKNIVERHGGKIWVRSEPGVGSTFYFTIKKH